MRLHYVFLPETKYILCDPLITMTENVIYIERLETYCTYCKINNLANIKLFIFPKENCGNFFIDIFFILCYSVYASSYTENFERKHFPLRRSTVKWHKQVNL